MAAGRDGETRYENDDRAEERALRAPRPAIPPPAAPSVAPVHAPKSPKPARETKNMPAALRPQRTSGEYRIIAERPAKKRSA